MITRRILKKTIAAVLCLAVMLPLFPACASALEKGKVYISSNTAKVYKSKSTSSAKLATVSLGQVLTCTSVSGSWAKVRNVAGETGYMKKSTLSNDNPNTYKKTVYIQRDNLKMRLNASTSSKVIGKLKLGADYVAVAKSADGKWLRIKNGSKYGYILAAYTDTSAYKKGTTAYAAETSVALSTTKGAFDSVATLYLGQTCYKLKTSGDYVKVRTTGGKIGWCLKSQLTENNPNKYSDTMYVRYGGKLLYSKAGVASSRINTSKNIKVTLVAVDKNGTWARVKYKSNYYYVCNLFLDSEKNTKKKIELFTEKDTELYTKANTTSKVKKTVGGFTTVHMTDAHGRFAKVTTQDGTTGYILAQYLIEPFDFL